MNEEYSKKIFSKNLKFWMQINGKTQSDLINDLGINKSAISTWCNGTRIPRMDKVHMLANYFNINISDLIEERTETQNLTAKNERDVAKKLNETLELLEAQDGLMFDGDDMDEHTKEMLKISLENALRTAKAAAKKKFNPNKNKEV